MKYKNISSDEAIKVFDNLQKQCKNIEWVEYALNLAWVDYKNKHWNYDGATFVREVNNDFWEVASFIHDWLNMIGYVGKGADLYFIKIMKVLDYSENIIFERCKWMQWTFLNIFWHKVRRKLTSSKIPYYLK